MARVLWQCTVNNDSGDEGNSGDDHIDIDDDETRVMRTRRRAAGLRSEIQLPPDPLGRGLKSVRRPRDGRRPKIIVFIITPY